MPRKNRQIKHIRLERRVKNCDKKRGYKTEKLATSAAELQMLMNQGLELSVYKCEMCGMWHLTRNRANNNDL